MRRGKKRRQNFAKSIQNFAKSTKERMQEVGRSSFFDVNRAPKTSQKSTSRKREVSPSAAKSSQKRRSLLAGVKVEMSGAIPASSSTKRKLDDYETFDEGRTVQTHSHKRSHTVDSSLTPNLSSSAPPHPHLHSEHLEGDKKSSFSNGAHSRKNNIAMQAGRFASNARADTTQTDYFRLKALGVNPDTPIAPLTKKRTISSEEETGVFKTPERPARTEHNNSHMSKRRSTNGVTNRSDKGVSTSKDDEEFFASIRALRSTLAESTSWFQSERKSMELSMTPSQASMSPRSGRQETPAERRLREIRERGHTPSRSEVRLRAMGDKSLLPASFWDGDRQAGSYQSSQNGKRKSDDWGNGEEIQPAPKRRESASTNGEMGFAALANLQPPFNEAAEYTGYGDEWEYTGMVNGYDQGGDMQNGSFQQNDVHFDEVIELSD